MNNGTNPSIHFNNINVGGIDDNGGIFIGENTQTLWSAHAKNNNGIGAVSGTNIIYKPFDIVIDPDQTDHFIVNTD